MKMEVCFGAPVYSTSHAAISEGKFETFLKLRRYSSLQIFLENLFVSIFSFVFSELSDSVGAEQGDKM